MKIHSIWLGSWFPKTSIHFQELVNFLKNQTVIAGLDSKKAKMLYKTLSPQNLEIVIIDKIKCIQGTSGVYNFRYSEDGLLTVNYPTEDLKEGKAQIEKFYHRQLVPVLSYLYSLGAKGLEIIRTPGSEKKLYLSVENVTSKDLHELFGEKGYGENMIEELRVYTGNEFVIIEKDKRTEDSVVENFINYSIFYNEVKKHADALLQTHRFVWDDAEKLITQSKIKFSQLIAVNQQLSSHAKNVDNIQSRIEQIQLNIDFRKNIWQQYKQYISFGNFEELSYLFKYLQNLFNMTRNFIHTNTDYLTAQYSEIQQKLLNRLQFLFLVGVIVSFITLGAFPGANFTFYDPSGQQIASGVMVSFNFETLLIFGSATIFVTLITIIFWIALFKGKIKR